MPDKEKFATGFKVGKDLAESFEGMMNPLSIALFEAFLGLQSELDIEGNCIEFGVYKGRSASLLLRHLRAAERTLLVDVSSKYPELDRLRLINGSFDFLQGRSEDLVENATLIDFVNTGIRFSHHDASHTYNNVWQEMKFMAPHILPRGLMVLDDFGNPSYMQVVAACFNHLANPDFPLEVFLFANNKAYLCRKDDFGLYSRFVVNELLGLLHAAGLNVYLTRTENSDKYRGFSIAPKARPTDPDLYGLNIFGDRFYKV